MGAARYAKRVRGVPAHRIAVTRRGDYHGLPVSIIVHHYFPLGSSNVGDGLVARAIREAVTRHFGECEFVDFPANDRYPGDDRTLGLLGDNLARTNGEADLVIVGGSNMLEARKPRRKGLLGPTVGGWGVYTNLESIERLKVPLLLVGMGTGSSFAKRIRPYRQPAIDEIRLMHRKAFASAVRDQKTLEKLAEIGIHTRCTGCPVTFLTPRPVRPSKQTQLPLLVSFPPPRILERWGGGSFMRQSMQYIEWLREQGIPVIVTLHDLADLEPARQWVPRGVEIFCTDNLDQLIERFESCRGVIGFRLHAALLGLGLGKPVVPVGVDWRGVAFIETFGVRELSIRAMRPGQFSKLRTLTRRLLDSDDELISRLQCAKATFMSRYDAFLAEAARDYPAATVSRVAETPSNSS